jgi:hypothetical protein
MFLQRMEAHIINLLNRLFGDDLARRTLIADPAFAHQQRLSNPWNDLFDVVRHENHRGTSRIGK